MRYKILEEQTREGLVTVVDDYMKDGWRPQGGVDTSECGGQPYYAQAMVMEDDECDTKS